MQNRRAFLKRVALGLAAAGASALTLGAATQQEGKANGLPGPGSIFEPRPRDLRRHWWERLSRFRLR
ncbi:MAG: hypothetical protein HY680_08970 [Chloroflexi bacterium]|nr:hypothetical protein [Chloroflexota bacterium]